MPQLVYWKERVTIADFDRQYRVPGSNHLDALTLGHKLPAHGRVVHQLDCDAPIVVSASHLIREDSQVLPRIASKQPIIADLLQHHWQALTPKPCAGYPVQYLNDVPNVLD